MNHMDYIRRKYNVPAKRGGRVEWVYDGFVRRGRIERSNGEFLRVRVDGVPGACANVRPGDCRFLEG